ncbi:helix-turn-helix domain-containing protein [Epilithonimonas sp.]|uniref:helix-turn-helix domain-containing protein n=1 Tax=Epilithonimonas sp. TaxID=2894511 RepID=UPI0028A25C8A|nr:helix-turn-helix domain-containing protein [Epilithonimonas sp.]
MKKIYFFITFLFFGILLSQNNKFTIFYEIKKNYEGLPENDIKAFRYLNRYIELAKKQKNHEQLVQGYKDAVFYSSTVKNKLAYADSTILASFLTNKNEIISDAYLGKGIIYYFNYKKYRPALEEYIKAYEYSRETKNEYLKNEIVYHLGSVKSYLGYYDSALKHFQESNVYFEKTLKKNVHPNIIFNNKKGYFNSLHRMIVCHRNLKNYKAIDSLLEKALSQTQNNKDYVQEYGYFLKEKGINEFRKKKFKSALFLLQKSLSPIIHINDFGWATVDYFYIGKSYMALNDHKKAIVYFEKVDSVFNKHQFILPELRENYELLIHQYKDEKNITKELYYTKQLLKADRIISKDFTYLSSTIYREYDTKTLLEEKERLEKKTSWGIWLIIFLVVAASSLMILLIIKVKNEKTIKINYKILEEKILNNSYQLSHEKVIQKAKDEEKPLLNEEMVNHILMKLKCFEEKSGFTENGLTINKLAHKLNTNSAYLSQIINEYKGVNFNRYLSELRINYITNKLYNDRVFLNYKIETLAEKCGIASRTNFSNLFQEINGIRPTDFIKKRLKTIKNN